MTILFVVVVACGQGDDAPAATPVIATVPAASTPPGAENIAERASAPASPSAAEEGTAASPADKVWERCVGDTSAWIGDAGLPTGQLSGGISGLDTGEYVDLVVKDPAGREAARVRVTNGSWQLGAVALPAGFNCVAPDAPGYRYAPPNGTYFRVPSPGVTWEHDGVNYHFRRGVPETDCEFVACREPQYFFVVIQGFVLGPEEFQGEVHFSEVPLALAPGECITPFAFCTRFPSPVRLQTESEFPEVLPGGLQIAVSVGAGVWGLQKERGFARRRFLVRLVAPGYEVSPAGYTVPVVSRFLEGWVPDIDFTVEGELATR